MRQELGEEWQVGSVGTVLWNDRISYHVSFHHFIKFQLPQRQDNASFYTRRYFANPETRSVQKCWEMCTVMTVTWNLSAGLGVNNTSPSLVTPLSPSLWSAKPSLPPTGLKRCVVTCFRSCHSLTDSTLSSIILCRALWILHLVEYLSCLEVQY